MENENLQIVQPIKNKVGRPIKEDKQTKREIYEFHNARLKDKGYFKDYYKSKIELIECECCNHEIKKYSLSRHQKSKYCLAIKNKII
jgi:hypothetical protein